MEPELISFEDECRARFATFCNLYKLSAYHSMKRKYVEKAYQEIDVYLDWRDVQGL